MPFDVAEEAADLFAKIICFCIAIFSYLFDIVCSILSPTFEEGSLEASLPGGSRRSEVSVRLFPLKYVASSRVFVSSDSADRMLITEALHARGHFMSSEASDWLENE